MIGSPDLLAFTGTEGFGEGVEEEEAPGLPEELSVPLLPSSHPWSSSAQFVRDFILVAEFSEQVGPKPVLTVPADHRVTGSFDLNHFSVRIMSVDYQASGPGQAHHHHPPSSAGPQLSFSEDSKVILGDSAEDAFAYVHHLTLYDLQARGMVRPFCMAYVCSDQAKLTENFCELSAGFSRASDSLKTGNRQAFSMELQRKLQELESRRLTLLQDSESPRASNGFAGAEGKRDELEAVELSIFNHRDLLRQVTSYPNRKLKQPDFLPYDPADSLADPTALLPSEPCSSLPASASSFSSSSSSSSSSSHKSERSLKPLEELCNAYFLSLTKEQLADTERRLRGDRSVLRTARVARRLSRKLTLTNFLFELWRPEDAEEEEEELKTTSASKGDTAGFEPEPPPALESFFSCVEELPIKLEAGEAGTGAPERGADAEMTGSVSSGDSIEVLGTEKSYRTQRVLAGTDSRETPAGTSDACLRRAAVDGGVRRVRAYAKRANSEDSIEVLSTTESIVPDDLTAITEEEAEHQTPVNGSEAAEEPRVDGKSGRVLGDRRSPGGFASDGKEGDGEPEAAERGSVDCVESLTEAAVEDGVEVNCMKKSEAQEDTSSERTPKLLHAEEAAEAPPPWPMVHRAVRSVPDLVVDFSPPRSLTETDQWSPPRPPLRLLSVDEASDCVSFSGSSEVPSPVAGGGGGSAAACSDRRRRRRKAGLRALRFVKHNSFSRHAVFCLLSGRPLVVVGGDEGAVRKHVDALSLFLPAPGPEGGGGGAVMPCLTTPLQLTDLLTWRLIGIHRSPSSSSSPAILHSLTRYSRYLALLDLDQRTLRGPPYSGTLLSRMADPQSAVGRGLTYLLHLESCLTALANHVLLHTFEPASRPPAGRGGGAEDVLTARGVCGSDSDRKVVRFLSELVKRHHAGRGPPVLSFSYEPVQLHRNTYAT